MQISIHASGSFLTAAAGGSAERALASVVDNAKDER
jgi:hypothetical protein